MSRFHDSVRHYAELKFGKDNEPAIVQWMDYWEETAARNQELLDIFRAQLRIDFRGKQVLDVGCGTGGLGQFVLEEGGRYVGADFFPAVLEMANALLRELPQSGKAHLIQASAAHLPVAGTSIDIAVAFDVIEHLAGGESSQVRFLQEIRRVLRPNGLLLLTTPNRLHPYDAHSSLWGTPYLPVGLADRYIRWRNPSFLQEYKTFGEIHLLTPWKMKRLLDQAGLRLVNEFPGGMALEDYPPAKRACLKLLGKCGLGWFAPQCFWVPACRVEDWGQLQRIRKRKHAETVFSVGTGIEDLPGATTDRPTFADGLEPSAAERSGDSSGGAGKGGGVAKADFQSLVRSYAEMKFGSQNESAISKWVGYWTETLSRNFDLVRAFRSRIRINFQGKRVLDIGCGTGGLSRIVTQEGGSYIGSDFFGGVLEMAQLFIRGLPHRENASLLRASGTHLPLADASIDVVVAFDVIEHLAAGEPWQIAFLQEIRRILRSDGVLLLTTPNWLYPFEGHTFLYGPQYLPVSLADRYIRWKNPSFLQEYKTYGEVHLLTPWKLRRLLEAAGLQVVHDFPWSMDVKDYPWMHRASFRFLEEIGLGWAPTSGFWFAASRAEDWSRVRLLKRKRRYRRQAFS